ncbi:phoH-like family protein [Coprobacillus sp. CAG:698]|nr:phoH-like family protein [Coprobacillus sp. CAG:698]
MNNYKEIYSLNEEVQDLDVRGPNDSFINAIESCLKIEIVIDDRKVFLKEEDLVYEKRVCNIFEAMETLLINNIVLNLSDVHALINNIDDNNVKSIVSLYLKKDVLITNVYGKPIYPKTLNQKLYIKSLEDNDIVFAIGPAGTGKTFLGVMFALKYLKSFKVRRIVLVRPIVEAGEKLGFLPGDLKEKIDPYLIPIYDALNDAIGKEQVEKLIERGTIEVAPLAYMRGRTLDNAIIILDEAQNATLTQMKMFLTRLGFGSKMIVTGDLSQIDLPNKSVSGMVEAIDLLNDIEGIKMIKFQREDVMRHPLVFKIIERYDNKR